MEKLRKTIQIVQIKQKLIKPIDKVGIREYNPIIEFEQVKKGVEYNEEYHHRTSELYHVLLSNVILPGIFYGQVF